MAQNYYHAKYFHANYWHADYWAEFVAPPAAGTYWHPNYWHDNYWHANYWASVVAIDTVPLRGVADSLADLSVFVERFPSLEAFSFLSAPAARISVDRYSQLGHAADSLAHVLAAHLRSYGFTSLAALWMRGLSALAVGIPAVIDGATESWANVRAEILREAVIDGAAAGFADADAFRDRYVLFRGDENSRSAVRPGVIRRAFLVGIVQSDGSVFTTIVTPTSVSLDAPGAVQSIADVQIFLDRYAKIAGVSAPRASVNAGFDHFVTIMGEAASVGDLGTFADVFYVVECVSDTFGDLHEGRVIVPTEGPTFRVRGRDLVIAAPGRDFVFKTRDGKIYKTVKRGG